VHFDYLCDTKPRENVVKILDQKGFSTVVIVLAFVMVGVVGVVGWRLVKNNEPKLHVSDTWVEYKAANHPIMFDYPSNWQVLTTDGSTGTYLDEVDAATFTYYVQEPQTSREIKFGAIAKSLIEVTRWRDSVYAKPNFYTIAEIANPITKKTDFEFQGQKAVRFETIGITAFPPDDAPAHIKKANPKKPVYLTEIYIESSGKTYSVIYGGHVSLEDSNPFLRIYQSFKIL
jgi:hypothetical protein